MRGIKSLATEQEPACMCAGYAGARLPCDAGPVPHATEIRAGIPRMEPALLKCRRLAGPRAHAACEMGPQALLGNPGKYRTPWRPLPQKRAMGRVCCLVDSALVKMKEIVPDRHGR